MKGVLRAEGADRIKIRLRGPQLLQLDSDIRLLLEMHLLVLEESCLGADLNAAARFDNGLDVVLDLFYEVFPGFPRSLWSSLLPNNTHWRL